MDDHVALQLPADSGDRALRGWVRQVDAEDTDDGLQRGFLAGAIVKVRVEHRLNSARQLLGCRSEELARDVSSEIQRLEVSDDSFGALLVHFSPLVCK